MTKYTWILGLLAVGTLFFTACDDSRFNRSPPDGKGTLYVDNNTSEELRVYINGTRMEDVRARRYRFFDLDPGVYRVALDGKDSRRSWSGDVDVLLKRRTVMDITIDRNDFRRLDALIYFD